MASAADPPASLLIGSLPVGVLLAPWPLRALGCDACLQTVPVRGCRRFGPTTLCPRCSAAYLQAWASGRHLRPDHYVREQRDGASRTVARRGQKVPLA